MKFRRILPAVALLCGGIVSALSDGRALSAPAAPQSLGKFGDWEAFVESGADGKVCYAATLPKQSKNAPDERGRAYTMLSDHPADKSFGVVGITAGFALKKGAPAELEVNGAKFDLYTVGDTAWSRDDKAVVAALAKSRVATFVGYPAKGEAVADSYGLAGFADARAAIDKACPTK
jgi:hypothetical protein